MGSRRGNAFWLSPWHATVWTLEVQTVGGGSANSNLHPYTKQAPCQSHKQPTKTQTNCYFIIGYVSVLIEASVKFSSEFRKYWPSPVKNFLYFQKICYLELLGACKNTLKKPVMLRVAFWLCTPRDMNVFMVLGWVATYHPAFSFETSPSSPINELTSTRD